ncbi:MAG: hypothetical protein NTV01_07285 [Bacteroidia bacterium]|nr:hypothetical protein [Bacteroidia bacterium]
MKASLDKIDMIFEFAGLWGLPSKCGLKRFAVNGKQGILVSELYQNNTGTSVTQVTTSLAMQICERFNIDPKNLIYIEHSPDMNSKLSFYNEEFYKVNFEIIDGKLVNPSWQMLTMDEIKTYFEDV